MTGQSRNLELERQLSMQAADAVGHQFAGERLTEFAEQRAGAGPVRDLETRDFRREVIEELADARNYLLWLWEQATAAGDVETAHQALGILTVIVVAFAEALKLPTPETR